MPLNEKTVASEQHTLFGGPLPPSPRRVRATEDETNLTPVGQTQAAYRTAREAVAQDAVAHGMGDRFDWRTQRRLNPRERDALGSNHPEMFAFVPGSQTIRPKVVDVFRGFYEHYDKWYRKASESFQGISEYTAKQFARAEGITIEQGTTTPCLLRIEKGGHLFSANGAYLPDVLGVLAKKVKGGLDQADGPAPRQARTQKTALERMWEQMGPEMQAKRQAHFHFAARAKLFHDRREQGISFALTENDWQIAEQIGIPRADARTFEELGAAGVAQALFIEVARRTRIVEDVMDEGVSKALLPGESMQRVTDEVGYQERRQNDRYFGTRDNPVSTAE